MSKWRQRVKDDTADWLRAERARRRIAFLKSQRQRRAEVERLARAGLHPVALPSLDDAFAAVGLGWL